MVVPPEARGDCHDPEPVRRRGDPCCRVVAARAGAIALRGGRAGVPRRSVDDLHRRLDPRLRLPLHANRRPAAALWRHHPAARDRKSTRLNSSHVKISYAVFCLKKKKKKNFVFFCEQKKKNKQNK